MRLSLGSSGRDLSVRAEGGKALAVVDTRSFEAALPVSEAHRWPTGVLVFAVLMTGVVLVDGAVRIRGRAPSTV
ncbi:MAG TPA: hypothetical protein VFG93_01750 [Gaiellaceae bacterium]|nr:hypothetical protein [Gaiellaceae bacterium]